MRELDGAWHPAAVLVRAVRRLMFVMVYPAFLLGHALLAGLAGDGGGVFPAACLPEPAQSTLLVVLSVRRVCRRQCVWREQCAWRARCAWQRRCACRAGCAGRGARRLAARCAWQRRAPAVADCASARGRLRLAAAVRLATRRAVRRRGGARTIAGVDRTIRRARLAAADTPAGAGSLGHGQGFAACDFDLGGSLPRVPPSWPPCARSWTRACRPSRASRTLPSLMRAAACLRARLASRLASFSRLRARLSSSLAIRTRCLATSASSRARSKGSPGVSCSLPVFFMRGPAKRKNDQSHTSARALPPLPSYPQNLCITMWTERRAVTAKAEPEQGLASRARVFANGGAAVSELRVITAAPPNMRGGDAIASAVFAAIERSVGNLQHALRELPFAGRARDRDRTVRSSR